MEFKTAPASTVIVSDRAVKGIAAVTGNVDLGNDRIKHGAFKKTILEGKARIKHLWQHDFTSPPVAIIKELNEIGKGDLPQDLLEKAPDATGGLQVVREYLNTPRGEEVLAGIKAGAITEMSFGFDPVKFSFEEDEESKMLIRNIQEVRLWDTSDVNWGMNPATQADVKSAIAYRDTGKADEGASWSAPNLGDFTGDSWADLKSSDITRIAAHFAFTVNMPPESFGDLKLPHHEAAKSGVGPAVWRGVAAAMGALMGARGGADIPEADRKAVYNHLAKHYDQFGKEPPDFKSVEFIYLSKTADWKAGRVLSAANLEKLKNALAVLEDILSAAEPSKDDEKALAALLQTLAFYEHDPILLGMR